jgi:hypothetical protein
LKQPGGIVSNHKEPEVVIIAILIFWIADIEEIVSGIGIIHLGNSWW